MRQRADGNPVHTRFREFSHVLERNSSGRFGANFSGAAWLRTSATASRTRFGSMLSSRMTSGLNAERGAQFVQVRDFDFDPPGAAFGRLRRRERRRDASRQPNVIFLDQNGFAQILAVILAAAGRTAYFSRARKPGVVFRVSRISAPVPSIARTNGA